MMQDINTFILAAARAGAEYGEALQRQRVINEWADYAEGLKGEAEWYRQQIHLLRQSYNKDMAWMTELAVDQMRLRDVEIAELRAALQQKNEAVEAANAAARNVAEAAEETVNAFKAKADYAEQMWRKYSAGYDEASEYATKVFRGMAMYFELYKALWQEIDLVGETGRFTMCQPEGRHGVMLQAAQKVQTSEYELDSEFSFAVPRQC